MSPTANSRGGGGPSAAAGVAGSESGGGVSALPEEGESGAADFELLLFESLLAAALPAFFVLSTLLKHSLSCWVVSQLSSGLS